MVGMCKQHKDKCSAAHTDTHMHPLTPHMCRTKYTRFYTHTYTHVQRSSKYYTFFNEGQVMQDVFLRVRKMMASRRKRKKINDKATPPQSRGKQSKLLTPVHVIPGCNTTHTHTHTHTHVVHTLHPHTHMHLRRNS